MPPPLLELLQPQSFASLARDAYSRGEAYARNGRVKELSVNGEGARAVVKGSQYYRVSLDAVSGALQHACECPMGELRVLCKHVVAVGILAERLLADPAPARTEGDASRTHFERDEELQSYLAANGLLHVRRLSADVLAPHLSPPDRSGLLYALGRHRFTDYATTQSLIRYGYLLTYAPKLQSQLPAAAWRFLQAEREELAVTRASLEDRLQPPADARALPAFQSLRAARDAFDPAVPPRSEAALVAASLRLDPALPGFAYQDDRRALMETGAGLILPTVQLTLPSSGDAPAVTRCSCGLTRCPHALAALDAALLRLRGPLSSQTADALEELSRPPWQRALNALQHALEEQEEDAGAVLVSWRLKVREEDGVEVTPFLHRLNRKGALSAGTRVGPGRLLEQQRSQLSSDDVRIAELLARTPGPASQPLLYALAGHPRVFLGEDAERPLRVERVKVGLVAEERNGAVVLGPGIDGAPLSQGLARAVQQARPDQALYVWDPGARVLSALEATAQLRSVLGVLSQFGSEFPPESHPALLERLSLASARLPVAMPRSVMGEAVPPDTALVLRLQVKSDATVEVELRARPLPEAATFAPGDGPRDVHARRKERAVHARRDFAAEVAAANALAARLPLQGAEHEHGHTYLLPNPAAALALLAELPGLSPKPELEWVGDPLRLAARAVPTSLKVILDKKRDWFGLLGGLSVEGERVELAVLLDAARRKQRFIRVTEKTYVEVHDALRVHLESLADHTYASPKGGLEVGPSAAEALDALAQAGASVSADEAWRELAQRIFAAKALTPRVPRTLKATLRDYQLEGFRWLTRLAAWGAGAVLADDMGLGKTVQALALLLDRASKGPALVIAPTSVGFNWMDEAARFAPSLKLAVYADSEDRGLALERLGPKDVLVLSYGLLARDLERLRQVRFATVIFDEAQALKNAATQRARAARELQAEFRCALSGTPLENHLGELWSLYRIVFPGLLGSWDAFRDRFATPIEKRIDPTAAPALARVLAPFLLRRTKGQVEQELPARTEINVPVVLSAPEWQLYEDARLAALSELETPKAKLREAQRRVQVLAALTRLRLLASHPRLYDPASTLESAKLKRLLELVDELTAEGHRALIFSQFTSHLALVREVLDARGVRYQYLDGSTPRTERKRRVQAFQEGDAPLFLISLKAGGFGLNLTAADNAIHLDPWWNPAVEDQASDRAHRIGQTRPVTIYRLVTRGTIEEQILALHEDKRALVSGILEGKDSAGKLSSQELLGLLTQGNVQSPGGTVH